MSKSNSSENGGISNVASQGGLARAKSLTAEERSDIARRAVEARWAKEGKKPLPRALHSGPLRVGDIEFDCAVVRDEDGRIFRLVAEMNFMESMGMYRSGALSTRRRRNEAGAQVPLFLAHKNLKPFAEKHLGGVHFAPFKYITETGNVAHGIIDEVIPKVCEIWIDADRADVLGERQKLIAAKADILLRGFAHVGIRALIDEATGFQYERPRRDLEEQLKKFLSDSLVRYASGFPQDYFKHLCRLKGVELRPDMRLPQYFGHLTNDLVFRRIAPGLVKALKDRRAEKGKPYSKLYQWTSTDIGYPALMLHLGTVVGLMKVHTDYDKFKQMLDAIAPPYPTVPGLFDKAEDWQTPAGV
jgi:hypothetical protein